MGKKDDEPQALGDIAADALQAGGDELVMSSEQTALIPACRVKFTGMSWDSIEDVPDLKTVVTFTVTAQIVGHTDEVMADGELRHLAKAKVLEVKRID